MEKSRIKFSLKKKLILLFFAAIGAVSLLISGFSVIVFADIIEEKTYEYTSDILHQTTNNLTHNVKELEKITFDILSNSSVQESLRNMKKGLPDGLESTIIRNQMKKILENYALYDDDILCLSVISYTGNEFSIKQNVLRQYPCPFSEEELYKAGGSLLWSVEEGGEQNLCAARAILDFVSQKPVGYVSLVCKQKYFQEIVEDISTIYTSGSYLIDESGIVVSSNRPEGIGRPLPFLSGQGKERFTVQLVDGVDCYVFYGKEMPNAWRLVTTIPQNEFAQEINTFKMFIVGLDLCVLLIMGVIIALFLKKMLSPIAELCVSMEKVGHGDFENRIEVRRDDEVGMLARNFNEMLKNIDQLIDQVYKLEILQKEAQLELLRMQINPHFLYNTLDTISWMARSRNAVDIETISVALGELLRETIKQDRIITVREELENVRNYITIQSLRFPNKFVTRFEVDPEAEELLIPNFILQPLVENAIIHGVEPKIGTCALIIHVSLEIGEDGESMALFSVADDGVGISQEKLLLILDPGEENQKEFIGIRNIKKRLQIQYGDKLRFSISSKPGEGTAITFQIPAFTGSGID